MNIARDAIDRIKRRKRAEQDPVKARKALEILLNTHEIAPIPLIETPRDIEYMVPNLGVVLAIIKAANLL